MIFRKVDYEVEVTEIQTRSRFLVDGHMVLISKSYIASFEVLHSQTWVCMPPARFVSYLAPVEVDASEFGNMLFSVLWANTGTGQDLRSVLVKPAKTLVL